MKKIIRKRISISLITAILLSSMVLISWFRNKKKVEKSLNNQVELTGNFVSSQFEKAIENNITTLRNLKARIEFTDGRYFDFLEDDAVRIIEQEPSIKFVEWIDSSMVIRKIIPLQGNEEALNLDISKLTYRKPDWLQTKRDSVVNVTHWLLLVQGGKTFLIDAPLYYNGGFHGTLTAGMDFSEQFDQIMDPYEEFDVAVWDERGTLFYQKGDSEPVKEHIRDYTKVNLIFLENDKARWTFHITPNEKFFADTVAEVHYLSLLLGLLLSLLVAVAVYFALKSREAEQSQRDVNQMLRALIESAPLAIYVINKKGEVVDFWNKAAEEMLGWKREEVVGHFLPHADQFKDEYKKVMNRVIEGKKIQDYEVIRKRKDGSEIVLSLNLGYLVPGKEKEDHVLVMAEDVTEQRNTQLELERSLKEKEVLLLEIHHRVKNNLAIITGLIELQSQEITDPVVNQTLIETKNRIYSIAGVHELLYQTESFTNISFDKYTRKLINRISMMFDTADKNIDTELDLRVSNLNINQAIPLGLAINELVTNSFKHAFGKGKAGMVYLELVEEGDKIRGVYRDNGPGIKPEDFEKGNSLGLTLIKTLMDQLSATYKIEEGEGFEMHFEFTMTARGAHSNM